MSHLMTKPTKWLCTQRRLRSAWASAQADQSLLSAWRKLGFLATHWVHSKDSDQTGRTCILLVLSCCPSTSRTLVGWLFWLNIAFNNFSVISRRCLVATRSSMLTFIVLPGWAIMPQTLDMIPHPVTLSCWPSKSCQARSNQYNF